jgi:hypothetical protein
MSSGSQFLLGSARRRFVGSFTSWSSRSATRLHLKLVDDIIPSELLHRVRAVEPSGNGLLHYTNSEEISHQRPVHDLYHGWYSHLQQRVGRERAGAKEQQPGFAYLLLNSSMTSFQASSFIGFEPLSQVEMVFSIGEGSWVPSPAGALAPPQDCKLRNWCNGEDHFHLAGR